ncbi:hypothetical protein CRG98_044334 [Punica granatum]|uniref:Uncharacterized protein n=1 Tax=Punica granatum TaxID=22663 RepID=A0A2I0HU91_PUNGR|nr:hypothetical protein CRG98_044334 [Punica granatum]
MASTKQALAGVRSCREFPSNARCQNSVGIRNNHFMYRVGICYTLLVKLVAWVRVGVGQTPHVIITDFIEAVELLPLSTGLGFRTPVVRDASDLLRGLDLLVAKLGS